MTQKLFHQVSIQMVENGFVVTYATLGEGTDAEAANYSPPLTATMVFANWSQVLDFLKKGVQA